ncbi:hypothetical protein MASR2M78_15140 [Treponema sp.]
MIYDLIIIGAGPAGLSAAIAAASQGLRTLLLEKMPSPARKLLISGTGQCNLTHSGSVNDLLEHYGSGDGSKSAKLDASRFLKPALHAYSNADLATFFVERSLNLVETEAGKIFPASRRSRDVLSLLLAELQRDRSGLKVEILKSEPVRQVIQTASDGLFSVETRTTALEGRSYLSKALIIATGGSSYPATGSSGDGYSLAASLGHRIQEPAPALVGIKVVRSAYAPFVSCSGFALQKASIKVYRGGKKSWKIRVMSCLHTRAYRDREF